MQGGLVAAEVHIDIFLGKTLPQVHHVAQISHRHGLFPGDGLADGGDEFVEVVVHFVHPSLFIAFHGGLWIDFRHHADHAGDVSGLGLGARHSTKSRRDEQHPVGVGLSGTEAAAGGVEDGDGGAMDDALRSDVHV